MSTLPLNLNAALSALGQSFGVREREGYRLPNGIMTTRVVPESERTSFGTVLAMDRQQLSFYVTGEVSEGGIVIHTQDTLYYTGSRDDAIGGEGRQSFVTYGGMVFRVAGTGLQGGKSGFNTYYALRYQDNAFSNT